MHGLMKSTLCLGRDYLSGRDQDDASPNSSDSVVGMLIVFHCPLERRRLGGQSHWMTPYSRVPLEHLTLRSDSEVHSAYRQSQKRQFTSQNPIASPSGPLKSIDGSAFAYLMVSSDHVDEPRVTS